MNQKNLRHHMAQIAARHAAAAYPGIMGEDTAAQLFALLTDTALAYRMEVEAELADPGPGQSLRRRVHRQLLERSRAGRPRARRLAPGSPKAIEAV